MKINVFLMKLLLVGAGSLGAAFALGLGAYEELHVVDMDVVEMGNLCNHPVFTDKDVGLLKVQVFARKFARCVPHACRIEEMALAFLDSFDLIICAVDSMTTRRWLNYTLLSLVQRCVFVEAGCEGCQAHARIMSVCRGNTRGPCVECTLDWYAPENQSLPLCTLSGQATLQACVQYAAATCTARDDVPAICKAARERARSLSLDFNAIDALYCQRILKQTVRTDPYACKVVAESALDVVSKREAVSGPVFVMVYTAPETSRILYCERIELEPDPDSQCNLCSR